MTFLKFVPKPSSTETSSEPESLRNLAFAAKSAERKQRAESQFSFVSHRMEHSSRLDC